MIALEVNLKKVGGAFLSFVHLMILSYSYALFDIARATICLLLVSNSQHKAYLFDSSDKAIDSSFGFQAGIIASTVIRRYVDLTAQTGTIGSAEVEVGFDDPSHGVRCEEAFVAFAPDSSQIAEN